MHDRIQMANDNKAEEQLKVELNAFIEATESVVTRWLACVYDHTAAYHKLDRLKEKQVKYYEQSPKLFNGILKTTPMLYVALNSLAAIMAGIDMIQGASEYVIIHGFDDETLKRQSVFSYWKNRLETTDVYQKEVARSHGLQRAI